MARAKSPEGEAEETHKKFTVQYVRGLKPRGNNYFEEMDRDAPLSIRVLADGSKNWVWRGRIDGRQTKRVIGSFNDIEDEDYLTLADARDKARDETRDAKRSGLKRPPHLRVVHARTAAPKPRDSERTFNEAFAEYRASHVDKLASGPDIVQAFEKRMLPLFGERKLRSLTRAELDAHFDTLVAAYQGARKSRKPTNGAGVNNLLANVKAMLTWCVGKDYLEGNPAAAIKKKVKPRARESFLSGRQLGWVQQAFEGTRQYRTSLLLLLHTGCRRSDIFGLKWSEVILIDEDENPDAETPFSGTKLVIKETKNDDIHTVWLSSIAAALLPERPEDASPDDRVFPSVNFAPGSKIYDHVRTFVMKSAMKHGGAVEEFNWHDYRRSITTYLAEHRDGFSDRCLDMVLNHRPSNVTTNHYNRARMKAEMIRAMEVWSEHLVAMRAKADALDVEKVAAQD